MKKKIIAVICAVLLLAAGTCIWMLAAGNGYGSQEDPLITLSYLKDKLQPDLEEQVSADIADGADELTGKLNDAIDEYSSSVDQRISSSGATAATDTFSVVTLSDGDTVTCAVGAEIMLRIGGASAAGSDSPALIDTTSGTSLEAGSPLTVNHMYMVTIAGCGVRASGDTVKVLIRGSYTVS